jgi:MFS family permease
MNAAPASTGRLRVALRQVARNRLLLRAQAGWLLAIAAEWAYLVSVLVFAYDLGGVVAVGLVSTLRMLPAAFLSPFLTSLADRFAPSRVLVAVHAGRGLAIGSAAVCAVGDLPTPLLIGAVALEGIMATLHRPMTMTLLPSLARSPEELIAGNAVTSAGEATGLLLGPAIGGVLLAVGGVPLGLTVPALAFGMAAAAVAGVGAAGPLRAGRRRSRLARVLAGFGALRTYPSAGSLVAIFISQTFIRGILTVLIVAASVELLGLGRAGVGYLNSAMGAGSLLGAVVAFGLIMRRDLALPFTISLAMWGIPIVLIGLVPEAVPTMAFLAILGMANAVLDVSGFTLLQRTVPNELRALVFGALEALIALSVAAGSLVAPLLVGLVGLQAAMVLAGLLLPALASLTGRVIRRAEQAAVVPHRELTLLRGIPMFAPLSLTALERLAGGMVPAHIEPGVAIVRQGERGDDFFVIASGAAEVIQDDRTISALGAGDGFGEIALLRDIPRTASVVARDAVEAYRLPRGVFLEAVTGNAVSADVADRMVSERLVTGAQ